MKYEDMILGINTAEMCTKDQARHGPIQEEIRSRYRKTLPSFDLLASFD